MVYSGEEGRREVEARRTRDGTFPPGSEWTYNPVDEAGELRHGYVIDNVEIPEIFEPGRYILSFRWDCEKTPQIWNVCANIELS